MEQGGWKVVGRPLHYDGLAGVGTEEGFVGVPLELTSSKVWAHGWRV